ncbi:MAG TPA: hypothetical protein VFL78_01585 [Rhodanobacteraceae bacterium]|jgi:hypothetical protein|nr:hypothetical protein [Rhodanobacteraceae bacterium]
MNPAQPARPIWALSARLRHLTGYQPTVVDKGYPDFVWHGQYQNNGCQHDTTFSTAPSNANKNADGHEYLNYSS